MRASGASGSKAVWIEQRYLKGKRIQHGEPALLVALEAAAEQLGHVGGDFTLQQIVVAELAQDLDGLVLRWGILPELVQQRVPDFIGGTHAIHASDEVECVLVDPMMLSGAGVLEQVPGLIAIDVAGYAYMAAQPRVDTRYTVPTRTKQ